MTASYEFDYGGASMWLRCFGVATIFAVCSAGTGTCAWALSSPPPAAVATADRALLLAVLFGDAEDPGTLDANGDRVLSIADVLLLGSASIPTPTGTATATPTASPTPTPTGLLFSGSIADLVPHGVGDTLIYQVTSAAPTPQLTETARFVSADAGGNFLVDITRGTVHEGQAYSDTGTQLVFTSVVDYTRNARTTCVPTLLRLALPVVAGQTISTTAHCEIHTISGVFLGGFDVTETYTPVDLVDVTVPAGTYPGCVHIRGTRSLNTEVDDIYFWPSIGIVRRVQVTGATTTPVTQTFDLTGGSISGQPVQR